MPLQPFLECSDTGVVKTVRLPDVVMVIDLQVLSHGVLAVLPLDGILMLTKAMDSIVPGLPVVLRQDVGGSAHLAGDQVLHA